MAVTEYDAVVVGCGATGSWSAKRLAEAGYRVLVLEAGQTVALGSSMPGAAKCLTADGDEFNWIGTERVGGRMAHWGRVCLRMSDLDFTAAERDGCGISWPLRYRDLQDHYDRVEAFLEVSGARDDLPQLPNGNHYLAPQRSSTTELNWTAQVARRMPKVSIIAPREATVGVGAVLAAARVTGNLTIRERCRVTRIVFSRLTDDVESIEYVDLASGATHLVKARVFLLAASTLPSTRLLLHSLAEGRRQSMPGANIIGHFLMDHVCATSVVAAGITPRCDSDAGLEAHPGRYTICVPRFTNLAGTQEKFSRGYSLFGSAGWALPELVPQDLQPALNDARAAGASAFWFQAWGEPLPAYENAVALSPEVDQWGIPLLRVSYKHSNNDSLMREHQLETIHELSEVAGFSMSYETSALASPGTAIHEVGTIRMGSSAESSALNSFARAWGMRNLYVVDGAAMPSIGTQNPTLTMLALADRACTDIIARERRSEL